jgi:hypothetical protein
MSPAYIKPPLSKLRRAMDYGVAGGPYFCFKWSMYELYVSASGALSMKRIFSELNWALREKL